VSVLDTVGVVEPAYEHIEKLVRPEPRLTLYDAVLKWYDIAPENAPVPLAVRALARRNLRDASKAGELGLGDGLGFAILHRCGDSFYFLLVCTWRNDNELWETVWAKNGESQAAFRPWPNEGPHRPAFCVWELGAVCHERQAWSDYLRSPRGERDKESYLRMSFMGAA
jgi:hypothetical protein